MDADVECEWCMFVRRQSRSLEVMFHFNSDRANVSKLIMCWLAANAGRTNALKRERIKQRLLAGLYLNCDLCKLIKQSWMPGDLMFDFCCFTAMNIDALLNSNSM